MRQPMKRPHHVAYQQQCKTPARFVCGPRQHKKSGTNPSQLHLIADKLPLPVQPESVLTIEEEQGAENCADMERRCRLWPTGWSFIGGSLCCRFGWRHLPVNEISASRPSQRAVQCAAKSWLDTPTDLRHMLHKPISSPLEWYGMLRRLDLRCRLFLLRKASSAGTTTKSRTWISNMLHTGQAIPRPFSRPSTATQLNKTSSFASCLRRPVEESQLRGCCTYIAPGLFA